MNLDATHDPRARCWVPGADAHADFPVQNLPLGVFAPAGDRRPRIGTAIGDFVLDLGALAAEGLLPDAVRAACREPCLNALFSCAPRARLTLRHALFELLTSSAYPERVAAHLHRSPDCALQLPFRVGDYTDFYVGIHHATNVGRQFRPDNPLLPNYRHLPIAYHGRASSIRVSGTSVMRPHGQLKPADAEHPVFAPTRRLDYELELGAWIAGENALGEPVAIGDAWSRIGGLCLLNDWSARDIQAWEYQPLGPFLAKNFMTTVSPWVVTAEALAPFRIAQPPRPAGDPAPLPHLADRADQARGALAIELEAHLTSTAMHVAGQSALRLSRVAASEMYWTLAQMIAHHTSNGCNLLPGDLLGTGTISGPGPGSYGSLMELSQGGRTPLALPGGEQRAFLEDGDELSLSARAVREGYRSIGFGPCVGTVRAARSAGG